MNVPQSVIAAGIASRNADGYRLPDGARTQVHPSLWAWQCEPGIGSEASCVGVPEPREAFQAPASGLMPAPPAPPPQVVQEGLIFESTDRYQPWKGCHPQAMTLDEWARTLPCGSAGVQAAAAAPGGAGPLGSVGCLILGLAIAGAVADVLGGRR